MVIGFSLAFDGSGQWIGGRGNVFLLGTPRGEDQLLALCQMTFAIITPALIARALVGMRTERDDAQVGLDLTAHGERAYDMS